MFGSTFGRTSPDTAYSTKTLIDELGSSHHDTVSEMDSSYHSLLHPQHPTMSEYIFDDEIIGISGAGYVGSEYFHSPANSFSEESVAATVDKVERNNARASFYILCSALAASLMSLDIKAFSNWTSGDGMFVAMCTCATGTVLSLSFFIRTNKGPYIKNKDKVRRESLFILCSINSKHTNTVRTCHFSFTPPLLTFSRVSLFSHTLTYPTLLLVLLVGI
jgi:hypothetical protein